MTSVPAPRAVRLPLLGTANLRRLARMLLPAFSLAVILIAIAWLNPRAISYFGFSLMLNLAIPIALATLAQMFVITGNDLDLSIGTFVGFVGCVTATWLNEAPLFGALILLGSIGVYACLGALIHLRNIPSIVVTLGMSFVWQGLAILLLPKPGGSAPDWLLSAMSFKPPFVPLPIVLAIVDCHRRADRADAFVVRRGAPRLGRQSDGNRPRRLVAACHQGRRCSRWPAFSACSPAWR